MARDLKELVAELDTIKTWFSPESARHRKLASLADELAEHAGGRAELVAGDPNLATPGPGVRSATVQTVDSVGEVADVPVDPAEQRRTAAAAAAEAAKQQREQSQQSTS